MWSQNPQYLRNDTSKVNDSIYLIKILQRASDDLLAINGELHFDFVADATELTENLLISAGRVGGIVKRPVVSGALARKGRAYLVSVTAHGDDNINFSIDEVIHRLRAVTGDVNAHFAHYLDGQRMDVSNWF